MSVCVLGAARGEQWMWGAPTFDQVRIAWDETRRAAGEVATFLKSEMTASFPSGGVIRYRSLDDPDNARGWTADGVVIDEASNVPEAAWYQVLRPMLLDTGGQSWAISTPRGHDWFWRECMSAADRPDSSFWNIPTVGCQITEEGLHRVPHPLENPHIPWSEIEQMFRTLPERVFRSEILAEFQNDSGGVFLKVRDAIDAGRGANEPAQAGGRYFLGVDLARVADFTVLCVLDAATGRQVHFERFNQISWERQIERIVSVATAYNRALVYLDSTGVGDPIFEALRNRKVRVEGLHFTNETKERLVNALGLALENGRLRLMDIEAQTAELLAYQYELTPARHVRTAAPAGLHDDIVTALMLANWGMAHPGAWWTNPGTVAVLAAR